MGHDQLLSRFFHKVGIVDIGIGILQSFAENPTFAEQELSGRNALMLGLAPFVTSKPRTGEPYEGYGRLGVGLFIVSEVLERVGGRMLVVSGASAIDRRSGRSYWGTVKPWKGTIVGFEVPDEPIVSYDEAILDARKRARELSARRDSKV